MTYQPDTLDHAIAEDITDAFNRGAYILPKSARQVADSRRESRAYYYQGLNEPFDHYCQVIPLVPEEARGEFPVYELGSLIAARQRSYRSPSTAAGIVADVLEDYKGRLVLATSRSRISKRPLQAGGMAPVDRAAFPMLDALTCDPTCRRGPADEPAWEGCAGRVACAASCVVAPEREDSCWLYVNDAARAQEIEAALHKRFHDNAAELRTAFGLEI
jgi:hypothetical protein